jgi:hypothetical protein
MKISRSLPANPAAAIRKLSGQQLFRDRLSLTILIPTLLINFSTLGTVLIKVQPSNVAVPVHYSSLEGFNVLGPWYQLYYLGVFSLAVTIANTFLAAAAFNRSRLTSFFLLAGSFVVALFGFVITSAFLAVV